MGMVEVTVPAVKVKTAPTGLMAAKAPKEMVTAIRNIEIALGDGIKKPNRSEIEIMKVARRSLIATRDIRAGEIIKESDITIKRPGTGILPKFKEIIIGIKLINDIKQDETFRWENFK